MAIGLPQSAKPADDLIDGIRFEFWEGLDWQRKGGSFHNSLTRWWIRPVYCQIILHPVVENPSAHQQEPCLGLFKRENPLKPKGSNPFPVLNLFQHGHKVWPLLLGEVGFLVHLRRGRRDGRNLPSNGRGKASLQEMNIRFTKFTASWFQFSNPGMGFTCVPALIALDSNKFGNNLQIGYFYSIDYDQGCQ